jgi:hypothetical protein
MEGEVLLRALQASRVLTQEGESLRQQEGVVVLRFFLLIVGILNLLRRFLDGQWGELWDGRRI